MSYRWRSVEVEADTIAMDGDFGTPSQPSQGLILFAFGGGNHRKNTRNRAVAEQLLEAGLSVLLFDLLTPYEEEVDRCSAEYRYDIPRLAGRLGLATDWALGLEGQEELSVGYFGAGTGGAAAIMSAVSYPGIVRAVVSTGGRPDLADDYLREVTAPTLLIAAENDVESLRHIETAYEQLRVEKDIVIVPGATQFFDEPGAIEKVADNATRWFLQFLPQLQFRGWKGEHPENASRG